MLVRPPVPVADVPPAMTDDPPLVFASVPAPPTMEVAPPAWPDPAVEPPPTIWTFPPLCPEPAPDVPAVMLISPAALPATLLPDPATSWMLPPLPDPAGSAAVRSIPPAFSPAVLEAPLWIETTPPRKAPLLSPARMSTSPPTPAEPSPPRRFRVDPAVCVPPPMLSVVAAESAQSERTAWVDSITSMRAWSAPSTKSE